jgi:very-short-patch-repair endonuclease
VRDTTRRIEPEPGTGAVLDVTTDGPNRGRRPGIRVHRARLAPDERALRSGIPVTSIGRTLLDLAGILGQRELELAVAQAEREELIARSEVEALLERHRGRIGAPALRGVLALEGGPALTRSEAESRFLELVRKAALPVPSTNVVVGPYEIDFLWRDAGVAVEIDGFRYHRSRPRFEGDRRRDAWLAAHGVGVIRISWRQIENQPVATAVQIGQILARTGQAFQGPDLSRVAAGRGSDRVRRREQ